MKKTFAAFLLLLATCRLASQTTASVTMLTVNNGLSQGMVFDLLQSREGFIWIATKDGLNRYDGSRFEVFSPDPFNPFAIANSEVRSIFEDSRGWIWVAFQAELDIFDPSSGRFYHVLHEGNKNFGKGLASWIPSMEQTPDGALWLWGDGGIWKISAPNDLLAKAGNKEEAALELPCKFIPKPPVKQWEAVGESQLLYAKNRLLVATMEGLYWLDLKTAEFSPEPATSGWNYGVLSADNEGNILALGYDTSYQIKWTLINANGTQNLTEQRSVWASNFTFSRDGFLWAFRKGRLQKWKLSTFFNQGLPEIEVIADSILGNEGGCTKIMFDKSGVMWVGTNGYGLFKINEKAKHFKSYLPKISQRQLLEAPDGGIYSLFRFGEKYPSKSFQATIAHNDFVNRFATYVTNDWGTFHACFDAAGNGWSSDNDLDKLYRTEAQTKSVKSFPWQHGHGLIVSRSGALFGASEKGLLKFDPKTETSTAFPFDKPQKISATFSYFLFEDVDGAIWIFGYEGLTKAVPNAGGYRFEYFKNNPKDRASLSSDFVLSVADDPLEPSRYLWVGVKSGGLNRLDKKTGQFKQFKTTDGLPDNVVYGILAENKAPYIWLSTNKGLCRFHVRDETTKNFTAADGLQDNEFNSSSYLKLKDGTMMFGGVKGLTMFHPDSLRFNKNLPQVRIVGLKINNQPFALPASSLIPNPSSLKLSHDQNLLTFDFAALEFTNPAQNQYRYQLVPVDKDWVSLGNKNSIQFANLSPGTYTFKVDGSNNDGAWSGQPAELRFTIRPPWWNSWWAYLIYLAVAAAAVWHFYHYRLRQKIEHQEALRLREMDEFKGRFFTNITHEFRTPLTVILGMTERLTADGGRLTVEDSKGKLGLIKRNGENLLRLINQILDLAKLESKTLKINYIQGDALTFLKYIAESLHSLANAQNLMLRVESDQTAIVMDYDPERLLQIVHNLLSNAVKFTPSGGRVVMRADVKDKWLHLSVSDSGAGIPADELPHLFERFFQAKNQEHSKAGGTGIGLSLTHELVKALGGEISVDSTVGSGTTFLVKLPITNKSVFSETGASMNLEGWKPSVARPQALPTATQAADSSLPQILLVEDNPDVVEYLAACLQWAGDRKLGDREGRPYQLDFAYNGRAGIEKALETIPDLIVSDVMMPEKDGFEVVEALKNDERTSHIPIILLTAKADVESRLKGLRRGADAYLSKPFHQEELLVTVENLLEMRRKLQEKFGSLQFAVGSQRQVTDELLPTGELETVELNLEDAFLQKFRSVVEANLSDTDFEMPQLERALAMSRSQIFRKVKALTGKSPSLLIRSIRLHHGRHLLQTTTLTVSEIAYQVGYAALNNFSDAFQEEFGERPTSVRG